MKVFKVNGYFADDNNAPFENYLITELNSRSDEYTDDDIFYYGMSEQEIKDAIANKTIIDDFFCITSYEVQ